MSKHEEAYTIITSLDLSAHGITSPSTQIVRSLGASSPAVRPFIVLQWGTTSAVVKNLAEETLQVWAYDESSYTRIDAILSAIRDEMKSHPNELGDVTWNGYSNDLYDDIFKCATRYATFTMPTGV